MALSSGSGRDKSLARSTVRVRGMQDTISLDGLENEFDAKIAFGQMLGLMWEQLLETDKLAAIPCCA